MKSHYTSAFPYAPHAMWLSTIVVNYQIKCMMNPVMERYQERRKKLEQYHHPERLPVGISVQFVCCRLLILLQLCSQSKRL